MPFRPTLWHHPASMLWQSVRPKALQTWQRGKFRSCSSPPLPFTNKTWFSCNITCKWIFWNFSGFMTIEWQKCLWGLGIIYPARNFERNWEKSILTKFHFLPSSKILIFMKYMGIMPDIFLHFDTKKELCRLGDFWGSHGYLVSFCFSTRLYTYVYKYLPCPKNVSRNWPADTKY